MKERIMTAVATKKKGKRKKLEKTTHVKKICKHMWLRGPHLSEVFNLPKKADVFFYDSRTHMNCVRIRTKGKRDLLYISKKVIVFSIWL